MLKAIMLCERLKVCSVRRHVVTSVYMQMILIACSVKFTSDMSEVCPVEQTEQTDCGRSKNLTFWTTAASAKAVMELSSLQQHPDVRMHTERL